MDVSSILSTMLSASSITNLAKATETDKSDVQNVVSAALPVFLKSALSQSKSKSAAEGFTDALAEHAKTGTSNLATFFKNVDLKDGAKIVKHLLGDSAAEETASIAEQAGVSKKATTSILSGVAPLFMSLLGKTTDASSSSETTSSIVSTITGLMKGVNAKSLITGILGTAGTAGIISSVAKKAAGKTTAAKKTTVAKKTTTAKTTAKKTTATKTTTAKKKTAVKKSSTLSTIAGLAGKLLK